MSSGGRKLRARFDPGSGTTPPDPDSPPSWARDPDKPPSPKKRKAARKRLRKGSPK